MGIEQATQDFLTIFPNLILINEHRARRYTQIDYQCVSVYPGGSRAKRVYIFVRLSKQDFCHSFNSH